MTIDIALTPKVEFRKFEILKSLPYVPRWIVLKEKPCLLTFNVQEDVRAISECTLYLEQGYAREIPVTQEDRAELTKVKTVAAQRFNPSGETPLLKNEILLTFPKRTCCVLL